MLAREKNVVNLDVRMGGREMSKKAGQDTQSCRAVGSCRAWKDTCVRNTGKGAERQNLMEQGNVGSPEMNGNGCEDLRLVDCLSQGTTESSSFRRLVASPWKKGG